MSRGARTGATLAATVAAAALVAAGCGGGDGGTQTAASGGKPLAGAPSWCGTKKITLALADGFGDNNWRQHHVRRGPGRGEASARS